MKVKPFFLILLAIMLTSLKVFSQDSDASKPFNDYIVTAKGDTIRCHISKKFLSRKMKYTSQGSQDSQNISPDSIKAYYRSEDTTFFASKHLPASHDAEFVQILEHGKIDLCEFIVHQTSYTGFGQMSSQTYTFWYVGKSDNDSVKLVKTDAIIAFNSKYVGSVSRKQRESNLMDIISDNADLLARYKDVRKSTGYDWDLIRAYVKIYNDEYAENHKTTK